nr:UPF0236 family protein [Gloeothece verrucosa]
MSMLFAWLVNQVTEEFKTSGWVIHRRPLIKYITIFGYLKIPSPYLWNRKFKKGVSLVAEKFLINHSNASLGVKRALTEFGIEESFQGAAKRFEEHYGFAIEKNALSRKVKTIASLGQEYIESRFEKLRTEKANNEFFKQEFPRLIVELDGCQIRTGINFLSEQLELTQKRKIKKKTRKIDWREVRVGFARQVNNKLERTFVAKMDKYPVLAQQLKSAAIDQGWGQKTEVTGIGDGGNGLREALELEFPKFNFILDRIHLKQHIYQAADAVELTGINREMWTSHLISLIDRGKAKKAIKFINRYFHAHKGRKKLENLSNYLERFQDACYYNLYKIQGLPIGSGEIESAHRYIPQKRLKLPGATWHPDSINPMLALRIIRANDWWNDFWNYLAQNPMVEIPKFEGN